MKVLVTSFDPFGTDTQNSSLEVLHQLPETIDNIQIIKKVLPTQFAEAPRQLADLIHQLHPDLILLMGQAGGRKHITFERVAINCMSARIPDNAGWAPQEMPVVADAPAAYFTNIPLAETVRHLRDLWHNADISNSAGTFVCNCLFYHAMHLIATEGLNCLCDFVHLPYLTGQNGVPETTPQISLTSCLSSVTEAIRYLTNEVHT